MIRSLVLAMLLAAGCKTTEPASAVKNQEVENALVFNWTSACGNFPITDPNGMLVFNGVANAAFPTMSAVDARTTYGCDKLWSQFLANGASLMVNDLEDFAALEILRDVKDLRISAGITKIPKNIASIAKLSLKEFVLNPPLQDQHKVELTDTALTELIEALKESPGITLLGLNCAGIKDFTPLQYFTKVRRLLLNGNPATKIGMVAGMPELTELAAVGTPIDDYAPLRDVLTLETLTIGDDTPLITSIDDLIGLSNLKVLRIITTATIQSILAVQYMPNLEELWIKAGGISDISALKDLPLKTLSIMWTPVTSLAPMAGSGLETLYMKESAVNDLTPLTTMKNLKHIGANHIPATNMPQFPKDAVLDSAYFGKSQITNFCGILRVEGLKELELSDGTMLNHQEIVARRCPE